MNDSISEFLDRSVPRYLAHAPFSLCLRELNRLVAIKEFEREFGSFRDSVLDVGCGDGFWWTFLEREGRRICGVDIASREIAQARTIFDEAVLADVSKKVPFEGIEFKEVIGNCSLEHVPDIDGALRNLRRSASRDARLVMFVPTPTWALQGRTQRMLMRYAPRLAMMVAGGLNGFFQHWHLYHHTIWASILRSNGWEVQSVRGLGGKRSEFLFRLFLPSGFVAFLVKALTGVYPNKLLRYVPTWMLSPITALMKSSLRTPLVDPDDKGAYEYMIVARAGESRAA
jgi:ubiquinone/menaquinone biosynthesis C-methylase UbiE